MTQHRLYYNCHANVSKYEASYKQKQTISLNIVVLDSCLFIFPREGMHNFKVCMCDMKTCYCERVVMKGSSLASWMCGRCRLIYGF